MFLRNIVNDSDKIIFTNLAVLVAMIDDRYVDVIKIKQKDEDSLGSVVANNSKMSYVAALLEAISIDKMATFEDFFFELGMGKSIRDYLYADDVILSITQSCAERVIEENKNNPHIKRDVMESLLEKDIGNIDQNAIFCEMVKKPSIRSLVIKQAAISMLEPLKVGSSIQREVRKLMLFELIGLAYSDGHFSLAEKEIIYTINNVLELDEITATELLDVAERLFTASEEAFELINE